MRAFAVATASLALSPPVLVASPGSWPLARLGYGTHAHNVPAQTGFTLRFRAPPGSSQGRHGRWYGVRVHARVLLDTHRTTFEAAGETVATMGRFGICFSNEVDERLVGDKQVFGWYAGGGILEAGGTAARPELAVDETATCTYHTVRGGTNVARFAARGFGEHARLVVLPDSGLVVRRRSAGAPPDMGGRSVVLRVAPPVDPVRVGRVFTMPLSVAGAGEPLGGSVAVRVPPGPLRVAGAAVHALPRRRAGVAVLDEFRFRPVRRGPSWILVRAGTQRALVLLTIQ